MKVVPGVFKSFGDMGRSASRSNSVQDDWTDPREPGNYTYQYAQPRRLGGSLPTNTKTIVHSRGHCEIFRSQRPLPGTGKNFLRWASAIYH